MSYDLKKQIQPPIIIIGIGKSGQSTKSFLLKSGFDIKDVITFDEKNNLADFNNFDDLLKHSTPRTAVVSPGFPLTNKIIQKLRRLNVLITSEINLACSVLQNEKLVGVTGSLGKSTTVSLIGDALKVFDHNVFIGGNLGTPFVDYAIQVLDNTRPRANWIILELSSYQLENSDQLKLDYGIITYLGPNHLERYNDLEHYYLTKWKIFDKTSDVVILNSNGGDIERFFLTHPQKKVLWSFPYSTHLKKYELSNSQLIGAHNVDNLTMATNFLIDAELPEECIEQLKKFKGVEHRLERVLVCNNILYINDSKATTIESVSSAIDSCLNLSAPPELYKRIILLLGGRDKKLPWQYLVSKLDNEKIYPILFGECGQILNSYLPKKLIVFDSLKDSLNHLDKFIEPFDIVLLSPGGTSHDEFANFEERGNYFKNWVTNRT